MLRATSSENESDVAAVCLEPSRKRPHIREICIWVSPVESVVEYQHIRLLADLFKAKYST